MNLPANKTRSVFKTLSSARVVAGGGIQRTAHRGQKQGEEQIYPACPSATGTEHRERTRRTASGKRTAMTAFEPTATRNSWPEEHHTTHCGPQKRDQANDHLTVGTQPAYSVAYQSVIDAGAKSPPRLARNWSWKQAASWTLKAGQLYQD